MLTNAFVDHPIKILTGNICTLMIISLVVVFHLNYLKINDGGRRDYLVWDHQAVINDDKWFSMLEYINNEKRNQDMSTRTQVIHTMTLLYRIKNVTKLDDNSDLSDIKRWGLLSKKSLQYI